jgi:hypothetical protein
VSIASYIQDNANSLVEFVRSAPPVVATGAVISGLTTTDLVPIATIIYIVFQAYFIWRKDRREAKVAAAQVAAALRESENGQPD